MSASLGDRCVAGDVRAIARLISLLEDGDVSAFHALPAFLERAGKAHVIGITGPPGAGKSTLTDKLISRFRNKDLKVGVIAVDPSSPFSGGAILGDRLRMQNHATDKGVFIRSLASRGRLGGLSRATNFGVKVLEAAGYDIVVVETVGVGQSEIDIVRIADTVVLISVPGLGDEIQVIKAGIMEIGDIFVVNKADREGADRVLREIRTMLEIQAMLRRGSSLAPTLSKGIGTDLHHGLGAITGQGSLPGLEAVEAGMEIPPVLKTIAETGEGVDLLAQTILERFDAVAKNGSLAIRRFESVKYQLKDMVSSHAMDFFSGESGESRLDAFAREVNEKKIDIYAASRALFSALIKGETR
ncbi:MAG: LAO/AO transport system kinase [Spirochaetes bacterium]|nr:MAG: LAO/AO transport system kinase [Spirochaetota bacterium]